jgi:sugar lactone lactonase YvrE
MPRAGGAIQTLLPSTSLSQLVVSDGFAWGTQPGIAGDDLVRVDGSGALTVLSGGQGTIGGVAVDATSVYWTVTVQGTSGVGQLLRTDR